MSCLQASIVHRFERSKYYGYGVRTKLLHKDKCKERRNILKQKTNQEKTNNNNKKIQVIQVIAATEAQIRGVKHVQLNLTSTNLYQIKLFTNIDSFFAFGLRHGVIVLRYISSSL